MKRTASLVLGVLGLALVWGCTGGSSSPGPSSSSSGAPAPGPSGTNTPTGPGDVSADGGANPPVNPTTPDAQCVVDESSNAPPGVHFRFTNAKCSYSAAEVAAGIDFSYEVVVDADLSLTHQLCQGSPKASTMALVEDVSDGQNRHSYCSGGLCRGVDTTFVLKAGTYPATYHWDGHSYSAPADACTKGDLFPAGRYDLDVEENYSVGDGGGRHAIHGHLKITVTP